MWIFCCGAQRSGSTLQYNLVSDLVELTGTGKRIEFVKPEEFIDVKDKYVNYQDYKVFKTHKLTTDILRTINEGDAKCVYCFRDIRDVIVSLRNKGWQGTDVESLKSKVEQYIEQFQDWMQVSDKLLIRRYEDFYNNFSDEIPFLAEYLNIDVPLSVIIDIKSRNDYRSLKPKVKTLKEENIKIIGHNVFDKKTLLHKQHIQGVVPNQFIDKLTHREVMIIESIAGNWLIENDYKLAWPDTDLFLSNSQHADDYIAWQLMGRKKKGLVIEVGAFDGVHLSNSYSLEQLGWRSVCIEPNPEIFSYLIKNRNSSININCAVVSNPSITEINFFTEKIGVLSGVNFNEEDVRRRYKNRGLQYQKPKKVKVKAKTLHNIFKEYSISKDEVDIISIDVEGYEMDVLKGLDFECYSPKLFIIEANSDTEKESIISFFEGLRNRYLFLGSNYQNLFFQLKKSFRKKIYTRIDQIDYFAATQQHPIDNKLAIQSRKPLFKYNPELLNSKKGLFSFLSSK